MVRPQAGCAKRNPRPARIRRAGRKEYNHDISRNRQLELARYARYKKRKRAADAEGFKAKQRRQARESAQRHRHERNERRRERSWRLNAGRKEISHGEALAVLSEIQLRQPRFTWLDQHGKLQVELWESPEQLVDRLKKEGKL